MKTSQIELPVGNRKEILLQVFAFLALTLGLLVLIYFASSSHVFVFFTGIFLLAWAVVSHNSLKALHLKKVFLDDQHITAHYKSEIVKIPLSEIDHISFSVYRLGLTGIMKRRYAIRLSEKFGFGDEILLVYSYNLSDCWFGDDPVEIKYMKRFLESDNNPVRQ